MLPRLSNLLFCLLITLVPAKHCKSFIKNPDCCVRCPIDPKTRVAQLVEVFNNLRGGSYGDAIQSLVNEDFISYIRIRQHQCQVDVFPIFVSLDGFDHYVLHDDDWIKVLRDGSVEATFSIVALSHLFIPGTQVTSAARIVQTWIPTKGICNYQLKHEKYTDYRCFSLNK